MIAEGPTESLSDLTTGVLLAVQKEDQFCQQHTEMMAQPDYLFGTDHHGFLVRLLAVDDVQPKLVSQIFQHRRLEFGHGSAGHVESHCMDETLRQELYWYHVARDVYQIF